MAETKTSISELSAATTVGANDLLFVSQLSGGSYVSTKATVGQLPFGQGTITGITMNGASKGTSGTVDLGTVLTAVPSTYKTYDGTLSSLSSDGYATQAQLDAKSAVSVDNEHADVNILHVSQEEYNQLVVDDAILSNTVYVVSSDYIDAYGQQMKNLAPGTDLSDAVNVEQLSSIADNIEDQLRYSLIFAAASTSGTTQTVELADRANNSAAQESGVTTVSLAFPAAAGGKARDFILAIACGSTPPNVVFPAGATIVVDDYTDLAAEEGLNLYSFTEISADAFVVSRLLVAAYSAQ